MRQIAIFERPFVLGSLLGPALAQGEVELVVCEGFMGLKQAIRSQSFDAVVLGHQGHTLDRMFPVLMTVAARQPRAVVLLDVPGGGSHVLGAGIGTVDFTQDESRPALEAVRDAWGRVHSELGTLDDLSIGDLARAANRLGWSGALSVRRGMYSGVIVFHFGEIFDARYHELEGDDALREIFQIHEGTSSLTFPPEDLRKTVTIRLEEAIEMAARAREAAERLPRDEEEEEVAEESAGSDFMLFSEEELAEMALDDLMAIPLTPGAGGGKSPLFGLEIDDE